MLSGLVAAGLLVLSGCAQPSSVGPVPDTGATSDTRASPAAPVSATPTRTQRSWTAPPGYPKRVWVGRDAWVDVSVATLWRSPSSPRAVDQPALRDPADIRGWLSSMTLTQRRGLVGRADTQALLGDRVVVVAVSGTWAKVVVPDQPTPLDRRGYPGWVPLAQLTGRAPARTAQVATVLARTTWLRTDDSAARPRLEASFATRLPVLGTTGTRLRVVLPDGSSARVDQSAVRLAMAGHAPLTATGTSLVRTAQGFTGLPYLWAGRSGFGFDCSGLTSLVHRVHGVTIPRDADAQAAAGRAVSTAGRQPGDLLFYARNGYVHHVSMYVGKGQMVQSPATGKSVETIAVSTPSYAAEYAGARRYLP